MTSVSNWALTVIAVLVLILLWRWTVNHPEFDLADLLTDPNGKVSSSKFMATGGWVLMSWGFITLVQQGKMTEWYLAAYGGLCFGIKVAKDWMNKTEDKEPK